MRRREKLEVCIAGALALGAMTGASAPADENTTTPEDETIEAPEPAPVVRPRPARWQMDASIRRIPDGEPAGMVVGPVTDRTGDDTVGRIAVRVHLDHPYAGDLALVLRYDADADGEIDVHAPIELHLAREEMRSPVQHAVRVRQGGTSYFHGAESLVESTDVDPLAAFTGQPTGGTFSLEVVDAHDGQAGMIRGWGVLVGWDRTRSYHAER